MKVEQIYTGCLAQGAYYIESNGEAVIIDPLRETQPYLERAEKSGATIKYVLETHFHADFVGLDDDLSNLGWHFLSSWGLVLFDGVRVGVRLSAGRSTG